MHLRDFRELQAEILDGRGDDFRDEGAGDVFTIGGDDVPWRALGAGGGECVLEGGLIVLPVFTFREIGLGKFPVLLLVS